MTQNRHFPPSHSPTPPQTPASCMIHYYHAARKYTTEAHSETNTACAHGDVVVRAYVSCELRRRGTCGKVVDKRGRIVSRCVGGKLMEYSRRTGPSSSSLQMTSLAVQLVASKRAREQVAPTARSTQFLSTETSKVTRVDIQGKPSKEASGLELTHPNLLDLSRLRSQGLRIIFDSAGQASSRAMGGQ